MVALKIVISSIFVILVNAEEENYEPKVLIEEFKITEEAMKNADYDDCKNKNKDCGDEINPCISG